MNVLLAAAGSAVSAVAFWGVASDAAGRRRVTIGTLPGRLPLLAGCAAALAAIAGAHAAAVAACAGVTVAAWVDARTGSIFDPLTVTVMAVSIALSGIEGVALDGVSGAPRSCSSMWSPAGAASASAMSNWGRHWVWPSAFPPA
jgi:hypothetical protein